MRYLIEVQLFAEIEDETEEGALDQLDELIRSEGCKSDMVIADQYD